MDMDVRVKATFLGALFLIVSKFESRQIGKVVLPYSNLSVLFNIQFNSINVYCHQCVVGEIHTDIYTIRY